MRADLVSLIRDELKLTNPVSLVGHSMGGRTVMWTALNDPDIAERITVVDISPINVVVDVSICNHVPRIL